MRHAGAMNPNPSVDPVCYWVLLTSTLQFCYTSPSFNAVVPEAKRIIGRRFTDYLNINVTNPDTVSNRLRGSYFDEEDKGAVIGIEYASVSAIRHHLQTNQWYSDNPAYSFAPFSLVVSRAGGFILAFLHVKTELSRDCNFHLCEQLKLGDLSTVQQYIPSLESQPPYHIFQILSNEDRRPIIFSTPTTLPGSLTIAPSQLAEGTQNPRDSVINQGQTSCTKRTKATFAINTLEGQLLSVQCIILRHGTDATSALGSALLVMYRLTPYVPPPQPVSPAVSMQRYNPPPSTPYQNPNHPDYRRLSAASDGFTQPSPIQQPGPLNQMAQSPYNQPYSPGSTGHLPRGNSYDSNYPPNSPEDTRSIVSSPLSPVSVRNQQRPRGIPMRRYSLTEQASTTGQGSLSPMGSLDEHEVMSHGSMQSPTDSAFIMDHGHRLSTSSTMTDPAINDVAANSLRGRPAKDPPKGVICCRSCSTTVTPEWRKGPTGVKDMCNACGLRWNRRLKKMKGEGTNVGENPIEALPPGIDPDTLLEPQRSGGGSKKGHRKKTTETRTPALTTKPAKRRNSDVMIGAAGGVSPFSATSPQDIKYHHPHNPHYQQGSTPSTSRPPLAPLFDEPTTYSPPQGQPMPIMSSSSGSGGGGMNYHAPPTHTNQRMKPGTSPDSPHGFHNSMNSGLSGSSGEHNTPFSPPSYNAGQTNGHPPYPNANHMPQQQPPHADRPILQMHGVHSYNSSQSVRPDQHQNQHSPQFERRGSEAHGSSGPSVFHNTR